MLAPVRLTQLSTPIVLPTYLSLPCRPVDGSALFVALIYHSLISLLHLSTIRIMMILSGRSTLFNSRLSNIVIVPQNLIIFYIITMRLFTSLIPLHNYMDRSLSPLSSRADSQIPLHKIRLFEEFLIKLGILPDPRFSMIVSLPSPAYLSRSPNQIIKFLCLRFFVVSSGLNPFCCKPICFVVYYCVLFAVPYIHSFR